jgi:uncharacterized RDD family membrane protein YckC
MAQDPSTTSLNPFAPPSADVDAGAVAWPQQGTSLRRADRGTRLGAFIIDLVLDALCAVPGIVIARQFFDPHSELTVFGGALATMLPLWIYQWYRVSTRGQTLAKSWLRIKIVKLDGAPVSFVSGVLLRAWLPGLIAVVAAFVVPTNGAVNFGRMLQIADAACIFGPTTRCLHDYLAGTKVVYAS